MNKRNKIIYWISTLWLASGLLAGGIQQLFHTENFTDMFAHLGYPLYFMTMLAVWKILSVLAILIPRNGLLKEWAYAGIFFVWSGAAFSHIAAGNPLVETIPALILLVLTVVSWYFRPPSRRIVAIKAAKP